MASLQSVPNTAPGNMSLPPNLTQQHIQEVYQVRYFPLDLRLPATTHPLYLLNFSSPII